MPYLVLALLVYVVAISVVCAAAFVSGGPTEKAAASALLVAAAATQVAALFGNDWRGPEYWVLLVDGVFFVALVAIAIPSKRFWPLWAAASQLVGTLTHLSAMIGPSIAMKAYASTQAFWVFPILMAIAWGVWAERPSARRESSAASRRGPRPRTLRKTPS